MRFFEFNPTAEQLNELNMGPKRLIKQASSPTLGALAGMEFEMIVPIKDADNVESEEDFDNVESEEDFDYDDLITKYNSFEDIFNFFYSGDGNNSRRDVQKFIDHLSKLYYEWADQLIDDDWNNNGKEYFVDYYTNNVFDQDEAEKLAKESDTTVKEILDDEIEKAWNDGMDDYNRAYEEYREGAEEEYPVSDFLTDRYVYLSDLPYSDYIIWPYYTEEREGSEYHIKQLVDDFSNDIGKPALYHRNYHSANRHTSNYIVEPDSSLTPDNSDGIGLEFISPPMPITEIFDDLEKVISWAKRTGCYTNESTGLHMNVSTPNYDLSKLDYMKLALFTGDDYILHSFDRQANNYCKRAFDVLELRLSLFSQSDITTFFTNLKSNLYKLASRGIHNGQTNKYISINTKDNRIEFRGPGGDWLNSNINWLKSVLSRFVIALNVAMDENKNREEYKKKLYKLMSQYVSNNDILKAFVNFSVDHDINALKTNIKNKPNIVKKPLAQLSATADKIKQQKQTQQPVPQQPINTQSVDDQPVDNKYI